jgi:uncharacterized membrane protein YfcA
VVAFIVLMDFLHASHVQNGNLATNFGPFVYLCQWKIIWAIALPMAASNAFGGWLGQNWPLRKGNGFIRIFFW